MPLFNDAQWNYITTQSWPAQAIQGLLSAARMPGDAYMGKYAGQPVESVIPDATQFASTVGLLGSVATRPANSLGMGGRPNIGKVAAKASPDDVTFYHGGPEKITSPRVLVDAEGIPHGFSVTDDIGLAKFYARGDNLPAHLQGARGGRPGVVSKFTVSRDKLNAISDNELYDIMANAEMQMGLDEGDLSLDQLAAILKDMGINAIQYKDPEFGTRILDPSILVPAK